MSRSIGRRLACLGLVMGLTSFAASGFVRAESVRITLLQMNDVYELKARPGTPGGLSRVAALRAKLLQANPDRTFTVLAGDALSPSALGMVSVDGEKLAGRQMVAAFRALGLDFATFGNHEFDLTADQLRSRLRESGVRQAPPPPGAASRIYWFSDNVTDPADTPLADVTTGLVLHVRGDTGETVRIGVLGLTTNSNPKPYVKFRDPVDAARERVRRWRADRSCDFIIAVTHLTIEEDERLALAVPEINLILGGHEHEHSYTYRPGLAHAPIAKADANAKTVYVHDLTFDTQGRKLRIESRLEPILPEHPEDPDTARAIDVWYNRGMQAFEAQYGYKPGDSVFTSPEPLEGRDELVRSEPTNLARLVTESMRKAAETDVAILNCGTIRVDDILPAGPITYYDIHQILPYDGSVVSVKMPGVLLKQILDLGASIPQDGGFLQWANIEGDRSNGWKVAGKPLDATMIYTVAGTSYMLGGLEKKYAELNLGKTPEIQSRKVVGDQRKAFIDYLKSSDLKVGKSKPSESIRATLRHTPVVVDVP